MAISLRSIYSAAYAVAQRARIDDEITDDDAAGAELAEQLRTAMAVALAVTVVAGIAMLMGMT
jgi:hypothetical protein